MSTYFPKSLTTSQTDTSPSLCHLLEVDDKISNVRKMIGCVRLLIFKKRRRRRTMFLFILDEH